MHPSLSRRRLLKAVILSPSLTQEGPALRGMAGPDRVVVLPGKTYLRGWAGYGDPQKQPAAEGVEISWRKVSGAGRVTFSAPKALTSAVAFSTPGAYRLAMTASHQGQTAGATLEVLVQPPAPARPLTAMSLGRYAIESPFWTPRIKALIAGWLPHCIDQINRTDLTSGLGGINNFVEAAKALRGEPHGPHKGYVFSNAWVYQTIESISLAIMIDLGNDADIRRAHTRLRGALEDWIPKILAAQEPDGYLQTAFTLPRLLNNGKIQETKGFGHWDAAHRDDHEGYVAGYLLEAALSHHAMTGGKDSRLFDAARKLADCWERNLGPPPKKAWYDGHQGMEQALFRFGRYVDEVEGQGKGDRYFALARFLLDSRYHAAADARQRSAYDQSHLPVIEQYEVAGHAVRAAYTYTAMADVVLESGDADYRSAAQSLWHNLAHRKYYVTGGIGSGETSEGFGGDYSLRNSAYCESCSTCGLIFFEAKLNQLWHDARYADLYEDSLYNALLGAMDLEGKNFYYDNPLDAAAPRYAWHVCPCCVGNIPRTLFMLPAWMYASSETGLYVNTYAGSRVVVKSVAGGAVEVTQRTGYPWKGTVELTLDPGRARRFALFLRIPDRNRSELYSCVPAHGEPPRLTVNGDRQSLRMQNGYAVIDRTWKPGDQAVLELSMPVQRISPNGKVESLRGKVALRCGPLIYNLERADQPLNKPLAENTTLRTEWREDLLGGVMVIRGAFADGSPLLAIPNYARMNREKPTPYPVSRKGRETVSVVWIETA